MFSFCSQCIALRQLSSFTARVASDCEWGTLGMRAAQTFTIASQFLAAQQPFLHSQGSEGLPSGLRREKHETKPGMTQTICNL